MPQVRPAEVAEAPAIVAILRSDLPRKLLPYTLFACPGVEQYVRDTIGRQGAALGGWYVHESHRSCPAGVAEVRPLREGLFLNHVYVRRSQRRRGIGRRLMLHGFQHARGPNQPCVELDVLADNAVARKIYRDLGFRRVYEQSWIEMPLCDRAGTSEPPWHPEGLDEANRTHRDYGFSEFRLHVGPQTYRIGRLGDRLFRTTEAALLDDGPALRALRSLDPGRRLLCIDRTDRTNGRVGAGAVEKARTFRMSASLDDVLRRLSRA